jgi:hypothetical protein
MFDKVASLERRRCDRRTWHALEMNAIVSASALDATKPWLRDRPAAG